MPPQHDSVPDAREVTRRLPQCQRCQRSVVLLVTVAVAKSSVGSVHKWDDLSSLRFDSHPSRSPYRKGNTLMVKPLKRVK